MHHITRFLLFNITAAIGTQLSMAGDYTTPAGSGAYTMATLAEIPESGVTKTADGVYRMASDVTIDATSTFSIDGCSELRMCDGVTLRLQGHSDWSTHTGRVLVTRAADSDEPCGVTVDYDGEKAVTFKDIDFEYAGLKNIGFHGFDADGCTFSHANGKISTMGALAVGPTDACFNITGCTFTDNTVPAIGGAANYACGLYIADCTFTNNNTSNTNKPQINITVGGDHEVEITGCTLTGTGLNMVGGIAVGNLTMLPGANVVKITDCTISEHRYGITGVGPMHMYIRDNTLLNNNHETNPMNGGSGISLSGYGYDLDAVISGNHIENSLWGVTVIYCDDVNLGEIGNTDSPGNNTFVNNGNGGVQYDLYNNSQNTIYAQNNTWGVPEQTAEMIETVIYHKADNASLGEVIFMPAHETTGIVSTTTRSMHLDGNTITSTSLITIYDTTGRAVTAPSTSIVTDILAPGIYTAVDGRSTLKFLVR